MRRSLSTKWYSLATAVALMGSVATAQTRVDANVSAGTQSTMTARHIKHVTGTKVMLQGNAPVGTIDDVIFTDGGCIDYFVVLHDSRYIVVPWTAGQFNWDQRVVTLNIDQQRFREIPTYTQQTITSVNFYEPAHVQRLNGFFNINANVRTDRNDRTSGYQDPRRDQPGAGNQPNRPNNPPGNNPNTPRPNNPPPSNTPPNNPAPSNPAPNNPAPNNPPPNNPPPNNPNNPAPNNPPPNNPPQ